MSERVGLILAGGGSRGAYEVGVLSFVADHIPELLGSIRILTGTSVGAVNAAFLASRGLDVAAVRELVAIWESLQIDELLAVSRLGTAKLIGAASLRFLGRAPKSPKSSLLSAQRIWRLVARETFWPGIHKHIASRRFDAVAVCATEIRSGHAHLFLEHHDGVSNTWTPDPMLEVERTRLSPEHVLASAAIPFLFTPVQVNGRWFMDGGVRYNTPLGPAVGLGASSLFVVNTRTTREVLPDPTVFPGIGHMIGKLLDSVFLDRLTFDLDRLTRVNTMLAAVDDLGPEARAKFSEALEKRGRRAYRHVPFAVVQPTEDIGGIAAEFLSSEDAKDDGRPQSFMRVLRALFEDDTATLADAASYLLFDGAFAKRLIALGRRDAETSQEALRALLRARAETTATPTSKRRA
ncbi:MAG: patatin-like phospholipase family protein [Deltaproteobacteria bacterium]|nr:patatin-like phospholipase family protein [Deltaproteobacteria bacterium]